MFQIPMESLEPVGTSAFWSELEANPPGHPAHTLANSISHASSVLWPEALVGNPLFAYVPAPRSGVFGKLLDRFRPRYMRSLAEPLQDPLAVRPEWAV